MSSGADFPRVEREPLDKAAKEGCRDNPFFSARRSFAGSWRSSTPAGYWGVLAAAVPKKALVNNSRKKARSGIAPPASTWVLIRKVDINTRLHPADHPPLFRTFCAFAHIKKARNGIAVSGPGTSSAIREAIHTLDHPSPSDVLCASAHNE